MAVAILTKFPVTGSADPMQIIDRLQTHLMSTLNPAIKRIVPVASPGQNLSTTLGLSGMATTASGSLADVGGGKYVQSHYTASGTVNTVYFVVVGKVGGSGDALTVKLTDTTHSLLLATLMIDSTTSVSVQSGPLRLTSDAVLEVQASRTGSSTATILSSSLTIQRIVQSP